MNKSPGLDTLRYEKEDKDILSIFKARLKQKVKEEYQIHRLEGRLDTFSRDWAHNESLVEIVDGGLVIYPIFQ